MPNLETIDHVYSLLTKVSAKLDRMAEGIKETNNRVSKVETVLGLANTETYDSAGSRLVNVSELLEMILLRLPIQDLLLAERVSKQFQGVITQSSAIQRALFFEPVTAPADTSIFEVQINPLFAEGTSYRPLNPVTEKSTVPWVYGLTPLLATPRDYRSKSAPNATCYRMSIVQTTNSNSQAITVSFSRQGGTVSVELENHSCGSWRRMYLSQPPLGIVVPYNYNQEKVVCPMRFGELLSTVEQLSIAEQLCVGLR